MADFDIKIKLDDDFVDYFNFLVKTYGEKLAELNGFGEKQLNYTDFIDNFVDKSTVADASIDGNANVGSKDIVTLENEMSKPHSKLLAFNKIFYEIKKARGVEEAKNWLHSEWVGYYYMHDAYSSSQKPYCLSGETEFITSQGVMKLKDACGQKVRVLNVNQGWENGIVKSFGESELYKLVLNYGGSNKTVFCTGNHKWFVYDKYMRSKNLILDTAELRSGDRIPLNASNDFHQVNLNSIGVAHGFFIGDGYKEGHRANFCGDKTALIPYFSPAVVSGNEIEYTIYGMPNFFNELPDLTESKSYLYGWLAGFFAADGSMSRNGNCVLTSCNFEYINFARNVCAILGMPVYDIRKQERVSNLTEEAGTIFYLTLSKDCLTEKFFIRPTHKDNFIAWKKSHNNSDKKYWRVVSVEKTSRVETVYCVETECTGSFTLTGGVLTHNCWAADLTPIAEKGLFFVNNFNAEAPKHLTTFTDFSVEFVSYQSNRSSGAVGLPNFLVWSYYFWKHDVANGYYLVSPEYYRDQEFQRVIYKLNQPYVRSGIQSAFTNFNVFDHPYAEALFGGMEYPDGSLFIDDVDGFIEYQKAFMEVVSKIRSENMMTFPVLSYSLLYKDGDFVDEDFARWCSDHNMLWADSNFYVSDTVDSLSSCCRLRNDIKGLGYFNSIGGSALEVGSVKVSTVNLARIAYGSSLDEFEKAIHDFVYGDLIALDAQRHIIQRNIEKGLLPNYDFGLVNIDNQYSTVGIIGIYEAVQHFGGITHDEFGYTYYTEEGLQLAEKIFKTVHEAIEDFKKANNIKYKINVEQIPGERAAAVLMQKDQIFFPDEAYELPLYGNQFMPLGVKATIQERVRVANRLDKACNGGSILHVNLESPMTDSDEAWKLLNTIAEGGVTYFAFCTRISACDNNHGFYGDVCPICGKPKTTTYQRVVGFLTPVKTYSKERTAEFKMRQWASGSEVENVCE